MRSVILSLILTGLFGMIGGDARQGEATPSAQGGAARVRTAVREALQGKSARRLSPTVLCVVTFEQKTIPECFDGPRSRHPADVQAAIRSELFPVTWIDASQAIACVRVSRPIQVGDSTVVAVATTGAIEVDGMVESQMTWVWFRPGAGKDSIRVQRNPSGGTSDVAPMREETRC